MMMALGFSFLDRYDSFGDICFALTATACESNLGLLSLVWFGIGVVLAQMVPAVVLLITERSTHMTMRFNGYALLLELIDPTREELDLPETAKAQATGMLKDAVATSADAKEVK